MFTVYPPPLSGLGTGCVYNHINTGGVAILVSDHTNIVSLSHETTWKPCMKTFNCLFKSSFNLCSYSKPPTLFSSPNYAKLITLAADANATKFINNPNYVFSHNDS